MTRFVAFDKDDTADVAGVLGGRGAFLRRRGPGVLHARQQGRWRGHLYFSNDGGVRSPEVRWVPRALELSKPVIAASKARFAGGMELALLGGLPGNGRGAPNGRLPAEVVRSAGRW